MSLNNITPWWLIQMGGKQDTMTKEEFYNWLQSDEAISIVPNHIRQYLLSRCEQELLDDQS